MRPVCRGADINRGATATLTSVNIITDGTDGIGLDGHGWARGVILDGLYKPG